MSSLKTLKKNLEIRFGADLDAPISMWFPSLGRTDAKLYRDGYDIAIRMVREDDTVETLTRFFDVCKSDEVCPLFLFRYPNKSPLAVICSYLNTAAFAIDESLLITPFIITEKGVEVSDQKFFLDDFELREKYIFNSYRPILGFQVPKEPLPLFFLNKQLEYHVFKREKRKRDDQYDEKELENLFCSGDYENLFAELYPVIRYGLNRALESRYCDEDMIQDVCVILWEKMLKNEIKKTGSIGAFTISVCKFYVLNMRRKQRGRARIEERLATLMSVFA